MSSDRPPDGSRDPAVDALRVLSLAGIVTGHWLVTGLVVRGDGLVTASPLTTSARLLPVTWFLQTLGPLFFAAGFAAERRGRRRRRSAGLALPAGVLAAVVVVLLALSTTVYPGARTHGTVLRLALSPLWFAGVLLVLSTLHRGVRTALSRSPWWILAPVALLSALDLSAVAAGRTGPTVLQALTCWSVPYALGVADARGSLDRVRVGGLLLVAGTATVVVLVVRAGYTASAVGIPGHPRSTLDPPNLVALGLAAAQVGAFLLLRPAVTWVLARSGAGRTLAGVNRAGLPVYLLHQPVLLGSALLGVPGLLGPPGASGWLAGRAAVLVVAVPVVAVPVVAVLGVGLGRRTVEPRSREEDEPRLSPGPARRTCRTAPGRPSRNPS